MCCFPNSPFAVSPDMHEMKDAASNSAVDEITSEGRVVLWVPKEMAPSFKKFFEHQMMKDTNSAPTSEEWGGVRDNMVNRCTPSTPGLLQYKDATPTPRSELEEMAWASFEKVLKMQQGVVVYVLQKAPPNQTDFIGNQWEDLGLLILYYDLNPVLGDMMAVAVKPDLEVGAEVLTEEGYFPVKSFQNLEGMWHNGVLKHPLLLKEFNVDESQLYYPGTKGPDSVLAITDLFPDFGINHLSNFYKAIGPTPLVEAWKCHEYEAAGRSAECEKITSGQAGVNCVEHLSASAQLYFMNPTLRTGRQTVSLACYLDSGATVHACPYGENFVTYSQPHPADEYVMVANNTLARVYGIGTVQLTLASGEKIILKGVRHVPAIINKCLISVSLLCKDGFEVNFKAHKVEICKYGTVIGYGNNEGGMYRLNITNDPTGATTSGTSF